MWRREKESGKESGERGREGESDERNPKDGAEAVEWQPRNEGEKTLAVGSVVEV